MSQPFIKLPTIFETPGRERNALPEVIPSMIDELTAAALQLSSTMETLAAQSAPKMPASEHFFKSAHIQHAIVAQTAEVAVAPDFPLQAVVENLASVTLITEAPSFQEPAVGAAIDPSTGEASVIDLESMRAKARAEAAEIYDENEAKLRLPEEIRYEIAG